MAEFEDRLNAILSSPEAMDQIVSIAKALTGGEAQPEQQAEPSSSPQAPAHTPPSQSTPAEGSSGLDLTALMGMLGGSSTGGGAPAANSPMSALGDLDPRLIQTAMRLFSEYSAVDNRKVALLNALKPFLRPERYAKVDRAVQIAKLSRVIRVAFQIFQKDGEGASGHV